MGAYKPGSKPGWELQTHLDDAKKYVTHLEGQLAKGPKTDQASLPMAQAVKVMKAQDERIAALEKVARVFLKNHHAHHPTLCIDGCDPLACGEGALIEVLAAAKGE